MHDEKTIDLRHFCIYTVPNGVFICSISSCVTPTSWALTSLNANTFSSAWGNFISFDDPDSNLRDTYFAIKYAI